MRIGKTLYIRRLDRGRRACDWKMTDRKGAERSCAEALASARDLEAEELSAIHETTLLNASQSASTVDVELQTMFCDSQRVVVRVKHLWWSAFEQLHTD